MNDPIINNKVWYFYKIKSGCKKCCVDTESIKK